jgi:single-stranded-DNA-specific exonuclease
MSLGIECLLTDDINRALDIATQLDAFNRDRRSIEQGMQQEALALLAKFEVNDHNPVGVCLFQPDWHQGVIGILASRIKDKLFRPVIAFAADDNGVLKGSARSIPGLHIRDVIDEVDKRHPGLVKKFGGHAMAAGMTLNDGAFDAFSCAFDLVCQAHLSSEQLHQTIDSDGDLPVTEFTLELAEQLRWGGPWGQNFPEPVFDGHFRLVQQRIVGERHLKMVLQPEGSDLALDAIWFNIDPAQWPDQQRDCVHCVFQLDVNEFRGRLSLQLLICHLE